MSDAQPLAHAFAKRHAERTAEVLESLDPDAIAGFITSLPLDGDADVLELMAPRTLAEALALLSEADATHWLRRITPQAAAGALRYLADAQRGALLTAMPRARQLQITLILRQPLLTVGAWMDTRVEAVRENAAIADVLKHLTNNDVSVPVTFVVDEGRHLIGTVDLAKLVTAAPDTPLTALMIKNPPRLRANVAIETALQHGAWEEHDALPVVDSHDKLVGVIRFAALRRGHSGALTARDPGHEFGSFMDVANLCYIGLAGAMNVSIARQKSTPRESQEDLP